MRNSIRWIQFNKSYGQLVHELAQMEESPVGIQIQLEEPLHGEHKFLFIGDVNAAGDISGEEYQMLEDWTVLFYRRLLTAEELAQ